MDIQDGDDSRPSLSLTLPGPAVGDPAVSPKSPGSIFTRCTLEGAPYSLVPSIVLCYWDNIMGPRVRHVWTSQGQENLVSSATLTHIASHTLSGEICRDPTDPHVDSKFFLAKEGSVVVTAFVFGAMGIGADFGVHSLCVVMQQAHLHRCLQLQELIRYWMLRGVARLRVLMEKEKVDASLNLFSPYLVEFSQMLRSLTESGLPMHISDSDVDTAFNWADSGCHFERSFLCRSITCHLMTCGCSVVVGESPNKVNMMLATLGMFLSHAERLSSRFVLYGNKTCPYAPHLCLQGFLQSTSGGLSTSLKDVRVSHRPTTLIDLSTQEVKYSALPHQHHTVRQETIKNELTDLWHGKDHETHQINEMFHLFDEPETLVTNLMEEWGLLPQSVRLHEAYISQFMQGLDRKALALIRHVEAETNLGKYPSRVSVKRLKQELSLKVPGDFYIVLATAEKLKPGMFQFVAGDKGNTEQGHLLDTF